RLRNPPGQHGFAAGLQLLRVAVNLPQLVTLIIDTGIKTQRDVLDVAAGLDPGFHSLSGMQRRTGQELVDRHREDVLVEEGRRRHARDPTRRQMPEADGEAVMSVAAVAFHIADLERMQMSRRARLDAKALQAAGEIEIEARAVLGT